MKTTKLNEYPCILAELEKERIELPLRGVECRFTVTPPVATVELRQIFFQNCKKPLNCLYRFPLPGNGVVYGCRILINDRLIEAKVETLDEARKLFSDKQKQGHLTALVEGVRPNLFELRLGNLQPGDTVLVVVEYLQEVELVGELASLRVPFTPGIRYIPGHPLSNGEGTDQVPDAMRLQMPRIFPDDPGAAYLALEGIVQGENSTEVTSTTHALQTASVENGTVVKLVENGSVPDRDFVLRWKKNEPAKPEVTAWVQESDGEQFGLAWLQLPRVPEGSDRPAQTFYFLVDQSGSMVGIKWTKTVQALEGFIQTLRPTDRIHITFFNSTWEEMFIAPRARKDLDESFIASLRERQANGGTELLPPLLKVIQLATQSASLENTSVLILTDGQVGNEQQILQEVEKFPGLTVHTFGIDTAVNDAFLRSLAEQQGGVCTLCTPGDNIDEIVTLVGDRIQNPVLYELAFSNGVEAAGRFARRAYSRGRISIPFRTRDSMKKVQLRARDFRGRDLSFEVPLRNTNSPAPALSWARARIDQLIAAGEPAQAIELSKKWNVACPLTALIAWDPVEKKAPANVEVHQPNLFPAEWDSGLAGCMDLSRQYSRLSVLNLCISSPSAGLMESRYEEALCAEAPIEPATQLKEFTLLQTPPGQSVADAIERWANERDYILRRTLLSELVEKLSRHESDPSLFFECLHEFARSRMAKVPGFLQKVEELKLKYKV